MIDQGCFRLPASVQATRSASRHCCPSRSPRTHRARARTAPRRKRSRRPEAEGTCTKNGFQGHPSGRLTFLGSPLPGTESTTQTGLELLDLTVAARRPTGQRTCSQALGGLFFQAGFEPGRPVPGCASGNRLDGCSPGSSRSSWDVFRRRSSGHGCPSGSTPRST